MKCVLCGKKSTIEVKIDQFPLSERVRKMLEREFRIVPDNGVCNECLAPLSAADPSAVRARPA
jgi:hypothetical protein